MPTFPLTALQHPVIPYVRLYINNSCTHLILFFSCKTGYPIASCSSHWTQVRIFDKHKNHMYMPLFPINIHDTTLPSNITHAGLYTHIVHSKESVPTHSAIQTNQSSPRQRVGNCLQLPTESYQTARRLIIPNFTAERTINAVLYKREYSIYQTIFTAARGSNGLQIPTGTY